MLSRAMHVITLLVVLALQLHGIKCSQAGAAFVPSLFGVSPTKMHLRASRTSPGSRVNSGHVCARTQSLLPRMTAAPPREDVSVQTLGVSEDLPMLITQEGRFQMQKAYPKGLQNIHALWDTMSVICADHVAVQDPQFNVSMTYKEVAMKMEVLAGQLQHLGLEKGDKVAQFSENSHRWLLLDGAILKCGAANVVRGVSAPMEELMYIFSNSDSQYLVVQTVQLLETLVKHPEGILSGTVVPPKAIIVMESEEKTGEQLKAQLGQTNSKTVVTTLDELLAAGASERYREVHVNEEDVATLLYTSGTTGQPKGVVLTHGNLLHQIMENEICKKNPHDPAPGDVQISILPCWHIFERAAEYFALARGAKLVYSSIKTFKTDLTEYKPQILIAVPRLYETIYDGVNKKFSKESPVKRALISFFTSVSMTAMKHRRNLEGRQLIQQKAEASYLSRPKSVKSLSSLYSAASLAILDPLVKVGDKLIWSKVREGLGGKMKVLVSGGSLLSTKLDDFFEMVGERVIVGYGLTETSPVICNRITERNVAGTCGRPARLTELKIVDVESGRELARQVGDGVKGHRDVGTSGKVGVVWAKGPQVTKGYYKRDDANAKSFDSDGFFNTGDLGRFDLVTGQLVLCGREKDTIVLSNGENVEPSPIEETMMESRYIDQAMLLGQDQKAVSALVVVNVQGMLADGLITQEQADMLSPLIPSLKEAPTDSDKLWKAGQELNEKPLLKAAVLSSIKKVILRDGGFREWEMVRDIYMLYEPFTVGNSLMTQTLKIKRDAVVERYRDVVDKLCPP